MPDDQLKRVALEHEWIVAIVRRYLAEHFGDAFWSRYDAVARGLLAELASKGITWECEERGGWHV